MTHLGGLNYFHFPHHYDIGTSNNNKDIIETIFQSSRTAPWFIRLSLKVHANRQNTPKRRPETDEIMKWFEAKPLPPPSPARFLQRSSTHWQLGVMPL